MRFLLLFVVNVLVALLLGPVLPHWGLMILIAVIAAMAGGNGAYAFFSAALAFGFIWFLIPFLITVRSGSDLPEKISQIMGLENELLLVAATSLIGFLLGGLSSLTGNLFRKLFEKDKDIYYK